MAAGYVTSYGWTLTAWSDSESFSSFKLLVALGSVTRTVRDELQVGGGTAS